MRFVHNGLSLLLLLIGSSAVQAFTPSAAETALRTFYALLNTQTCEQAADYHPSYTPARCRQITAGSVVIDELQALTEPNAYRQLFALKLHYAKSGTSNTFDGYVAVFEQNGHWLIDGSSYQSRDGMSSADYVKRYFPFTPQTAPTASTDGADGMPPASIPMREIKIDIATQRLFVYEDATLVKTYPISSALAGEGSKANSNQTPLGVHVVAQKIGHDAPPLTIFKARKNTGTLAQLDVEGAGDLVTSRILWLRGEEPGFNSGEGIDSFKRYIYIHGTAEESKIGSKASHGCIRMYNNDVVELFELVAEGTPVTIYADLDAGIVRPTSEVNTDMSLGKADYIQ